MSEATVPHVEPLLDMRDIHKRYGAVHALSAANFSCQPREIHGLVGENGAGKSTLIKVLSGITLADSGSISLFGEQAEHLNPKQAQQLGVQSVFQELTLIPDLTVADNLLNVRTTTSLWSTRSLHDLVVEAEHVLARFGVNVGSPSRLVRELPLPERQLVEIVKALAMEPRILVLDEPTSALLEPQVDWLFAQLRRLRDSGIAVIFTSHRWHEIKELTDRVTVFRDGVDVGVVATEEFSEQKATAMMTGRQLSVLFPTVAPAAPAVTMAVRHLETQELHDINFELHKGEILGIGGLQGQGQKELFLTLFGALPWSHGSIEVDGKATHWRSPRDAIRNRVGIGFVPEDRATEALLHDLGIAENVTLPTLDRFCRLGMINRKRELAAVQDVVQRLAIRTPTVRESVSSLSGGNQQKVVVARWLMGDTAILLLYDVTRGVDVATRHEIYELLVSLAARGVAIVFYSSETEEIVHLASRVAVMYEGRFVAMLEGDDRSAERVLGVAIGTGARSSDRQTALSTVGT